MEVADLPAISADETHRRLGAGQSDGLAVSRVSWPVGALPRQRRWITRTRSVDLVLVNEPCKPCKPYKVSVVSLDHQHADPPELPTLRFCWTVRCEVPSALGSPMDTD